MNREALRRAIFIGSLAASIAACGQVTPVRFSSVKACTDMAQALCTKRDACTSGAGILRTDGDMNTCVTCEELSCTIALAAPDTGNTPERIESCVAAYAALSCADFSNGNPPAACAPTGARPNGGACSFNGQCSSGFCGRAKNVTCGVCAAPPSPGDTCDTSGCGHDQSCESSTQTCFRYGDLDSPCGADAAPCGAGLTCIGSSSSTPGLCQVAVATAGQPCGGQTGAGCDGGIGLYCGGPSGAKTCMSMTYVGDGAPCGAMAEGTRAGCKAGACYAGDHVASSSEMGTCKTVAADGAGCDAALGPGCLAPARCVPTGAGSIGLCTIPDPTTCL